MEKWTGEDGPELVTLPVGSMVRTSVTRSDVVNRIEQLMAYLPDPATVPRRMEVGSEAWQAIKASAAPQIGRTGYGSFSMTALLGVPVAVRQDMPGGARAWRLFNGEGHVLSEGVLPE